VAKIIENQLGNAFIKSIAMPAGMQLIPAISPPEPAVPQQSPPPPP
jgi:hypothetical protein